MSHNMVNYKSGREPARNFSSPTPWNSNSARSCTGSSSASGGTDVTNAYHSPNVAHRHINGAVQNPVMNTASMSHAPNGHATPGSCLSYNPNGTIDLRGMSATENEAAIVTGELHSDYSDAQSQYTLYQQGADHIVRDTFVELARTSLRLQETQRENSQLRQKIAEVVLGHEAAAANLAKMTEHLAQMEDVFRNEYKVVMLIDGNAIPFQNLFLHGSVNGGELAAEALHDAIESFIRRRCPDLTTFKIEATIYLDRAALLYQCACSGINETRAEGFLQGFVATEGSFNVVDVGTRQGMVMTKLRSECQKYYNAWTCQHLIIACPWDGLLLSVLRSLAMDTGLPDKVTMVKSPMAPDGFNMMGFMTTWFQDVFSENQSRAQLSATPSTIHGSRSPTTSPHAPLSSQSQENDLQNSVIARTKSPDRLVPTSWANALKTPAPEVVPQPFPPAKPPAPETILRNRAGQRLDRSTKSYEKERVDKVKNMKMCNVHYLRKDCPYGRDCDHRHDLSPTDAQLADLKMVARMAPCKNGSACDEVKCIYGHICPAPLSTKAKGTDAKNCIFAEGCRFPSELHRIDPVPVATTVIRNGNAVGV